MAKIFTGIVVQVYNRFTRCPRGSPKGANRRERIIDITPTVINNETRGDTITEAIIPPGIMVPSENRVTGLEKIWAPMEALTEEAMEGGKKL